MKRRSVTTIANSAGRRSGTKATTLSNVCLWRNHSDVLTHVEAEACSTITAVLRPMLIAVDAREREFDELLDKLICVA